MQVMPSSQLVVTPKQEPWLQESESVHASLSLQAAVLSVLLHPEPTTQASSVQGLRSSQEASTPRCLQPVEVSQESVVQAMLSLQLTAWPPVQTPRAHLSAKVQASPSSQEKVL